ncbi:Fe-S cluster assembly protein SufD [bacterium]|nr:MAG: Fe-S cluster assembly protein SufD [bacterium]RIK63688.1 MAG: Fe-S cluster assembly protein SufD [Planctomycetota bacterium]
MALAREYTMNQTLAQSDVLLDAYEASRGSAGPTWLHVLRAEGLEAYRSLGLPTIRHEEWRYTSLAPLLKQAWRVPDPSCGAHLRLVDIEPLLAAGMDSPRLVFINGRLCTRLSTQGRLAAGLRMSSLSRALEDKAGASVVQAHLGRHADVSADALAALNMAFFEDGALLHLERGHSLDQPLQLLYIAVGRQPALVQPRSLLVLEEGSRASVVEIHARLGEAPALCNHVTEVVVGERAHLAHTLLQPEDEAASQIIHVTAAVGRQGELDSRVFSLGAALTRNNLRCLLKGEGANAGLSGLFLGRGREHLDQHIEVEHASPLGTSRQLFRGVLDGKSRGVFSGKVVVQPGARKTDARQQNNNLLLSDDAQIDTKPQLEIYADDVQCSHGATSGRLDDEALFFLRSRGLSQAQARSLLTYAFCAELIEAVRPRALREALARRVQERFQ